MSLLASWPVREGLISLFQEPDHFFVEETGQRVLQIEPSRYEMSKAIDLVKTFHQTIGKNLEREAISPSSFFPTWTWSLDAVNGLRVEVALFGHLDMTSNPDGEVKWMRWGISIPSIGRDETLEVTDRLARAFIQEAPETNYASLMHGVYKNGSPIFNQDGSAKLTGDQDHYAMENYAKRFSVELKQDASGCIQDAALRYVSLLDKNVLLDENNWAVTLVSSRNSTRSSLSDRIGRIFGGQFAGHARIACEGVIQGKPFLKYAHLTKLPLRPLPDLGDKAQVEIGDVEDFIREEFYPLNTTLDTINGPTWARSRALVENMLGIIDGGANKPVDFALYGGVPLELLYWLSGFDLDPLSRCDREDDFRYLVFNRIRGIGIKHTCLSWASKMLLECGVILGSHKHRTTPLGKISELNSSYTQPYTLPHVNLPVVLADLLGDPRNAEGVNGLRKWSEDMWRNHYDDYEENLTNTYTHVHFWLSVNFESGFRDAIEEVKLTVFRRFLREGGISRDRIQDISVEKQLRFLEEVNSGILSEELQQILGEILPLREVSDRLRIIKEGISRISSGVAPSTMIREVIAESSVAGRFTGIPAEAPAILLRRLDSPTYRLLVSQILSSRVVLTPSDLPVDDLKYWVELWRLEAIRSMVNGFLSRLCLPLS